jgi:ketosteroid isomerase-like protein
MHRTLLLVSLFVGGAFARAANPAASSSSEIPLVAAAVDALHAALVNADPRALSDLIAPEVSYGHSNGNVQDRAALLAYVEANEMDLVKIETLNQSISLAGFTAIVRRTFAASFVKAGTPGDLKIGNLQIWQKQQGKWKLLARQAYKL